MWRGFGAETELGPTAPGLWLAGEPIPLVSPFRLATKPLGSMVECTY